MKTIQKNLLLTILTLVFVFTSCSDKKSNPIDPIPGKSIIVSQTVLDTVKQSLLAGLALVIGIQSNPQSDVVVYKIEYNSVGKNFLPTVCSGIICVPLTTSPKQGIVSLQHYTLTRNDESPSCRSLPTVVEAAIVASLGYVSTSNDYLGFGVNNTVPHSYHIYSNTTDDWLQFMQATQEFINKNNVNTSKDLRIMGFSQGGYNSVAAMKKWEESNSSFFELKEVYAGDGVYMLDLLIEEIFKNNDYPAVSLSPLFIRSYKYYYDDLKLNYDDIFLPKYRDKIDKWYDVNSTVKLTDSVPKKFDELYEKSFIENIQDKSSDLHKKFAENNLTNFVPKNKLYIFHSDGDDYIPIAVAETAYNYYQNNGGNVQFIKSKLSLAHSKTYGEFMNFALKQLTTRQKINL